jgi:hypothetical protein
MSIITISHEAFGDGRAVAERVADILGYRCISREVLIKASERYGIAEAKLSEVLEEMPRHWWAQLLESQGSIGSRSKPRPVNSRKTETSCITAAPVSSSFLESVMS